MTKQIAGLLFTVFSFSQGVFSQVTPPGLGAGNTAGWVAVGVRQDLDTAKVWQSMSYAGFGRKSNPDNYNPFFKPAIFILNQEFYCQFRPKWQYSLALSYRRQNEYLDEYPYTRGTPDKKQEFRLYGRISYSLKISPRAKITPTLRQEFRKFYAPDFSKTSENYQFRTRFRLQFALNLDRNKVHRLILNSEQLFAIKKGYNPTRWTDYRYSESRFSLFYSLSPKALSCTFNIGYMNNLLGYKNPEAVHYIAFDVTIKNPF